MSSYKKKIRNFAHSTLYFFFLYGVLFIPFPFYLFPFPNALSHFLFQDSIYWLLHIIGADSLSQQDITSDTSAIYVLVALLFILAFYSALAFTFVKKNQEISKKFFPILHSVLCYYLAMQLLKYGVDKLFKAQFYLPEPNILYTPFGEISKDLLFWSTMGLSYSYNVFTGLLEIIPALLLLFKKTRSIGLLIAAAVMTNIVVLNFSYDISVKLYSSFLLLLCLFLLSPQISVFFDFFIRHKSSQLVYKKSWLNLSDFWNRSIRFFVIALIFSEALLPYFLSGNFNDDSSTRPYLHGAYEVQDAPPDLDIKRFFIHRRGYLIFQSRADEMQDFQLTIDLDKRQFLLTNYQEQQHHLNYNYSPKDSLLQLQYFQDGREYLLRAKALDWRRLPALQNDFHWRVDDW